MIKKLWKVVVRFLKTPLYLGWALVGYCTLFGTVLIAIHRGNQLENKQQAEAEYNAKVDSFQQDFTLYQVCLTLQESQETNNQKWDFVLDYFLQEDPTNEIVLDLKAGLEGDLTAEPVECKVPVAPERPT